MKTIRIKLNCCNENGCKRDVEMDYRIADDSYERMMRDDKYLEEMIRFGVQCPICRHNYIFKPSQLKTMMI